jgi:hypothetical protein
MPTLRNTNWDYGAPKARYRKNELQLRQPKAFPIKVLKITLSRAHEEAELEAAAKRYVDPEFEIYEDLEQDDYNVKIEDEGEDEEAEEIAEKVAEGFAYDSADGSADDSDASTELPVSKTITRKPAALVDSRGRTRAATTLRKAQKVSESTMPTSVSPENKEDATVDNKKHKHGSTRVAKQPRKTLPKKPV